MTHQRIGKMYAIAIVVCVSLAGCSPANKDYVQQHACEQWASVGYECIGYEGFQWGTWFGGSYGGAKVWHTLRRKEAPGIIYTGYIQSWGEELHVYGPDATDAIKPNR